MKLTTKSLFKLTLITPNGDQWDNDELITFKSLCNHLDFKWDDTEDQTMLLKSALLDSKSNLKKGHHGIRIHKSYDWYDQNDEMKKHSVEAGDYYLEYVKEKEPNGAIINLNTKLPELKRNTYSSWIETEIYSENSESINKIAERFIKERK